MAYRTKLPDPRPRQAVVLPAVLIVVVLLSLAAYQYSEWVTAEYQAADSFTRVAQARALAASGVHYTAAILSNPDLVTGMLNGNPYDNAGVFQNILVQQNDIVKFQGRCSIVARLDPNSPSTSSLPFRFGVEDESGKINLNALMQLDSSGKIAHDMLVLLPNMTEEIANAILDWIDPDSDPRTGGAEDQTYSALTPPYHCKNGPLDSLEELLLVSGVTPQLLLGNDRNRNGILDPEEDDGSGTVDRGWAAYLTVYSRERNVDSTGNPRIYVNSQDLNTLSTQLQSALTQDLADYIVAYRMYGPASSGGSGGGASGGSGSGASGSSASRSGASSSPGSTSAPAMDRGTAMQQITTGRSSGTQRLQSISSLYDLISSSVSIPNSNPQGQPYTLPSPLNDSGTLQQYLPIMLDKMTTVRSGELPARININTAPQAVLATLPGLQDIDVQTIIGLRPNPSSPDAADPIYQTPAWLITQASLPPSTLKTLERYITARSQVYRVQSVGHFDGGGPTARIEAVIDTNSGRPRIVYWRDLTEAGKGFTLQN